MRWEFHYYKILSKTSEGSRFISASMTFPHFWRVSEKKCTEPFPYIKTQTQHLSDSKNIDKEKIIENNHLLSSLYLYVTASFPLKASSFRNKCYTAHLKYYGLFSALTYRFCRHLFGMLKFNLKWNKIKTTSKCTSSFMIISET